MASASNLSSDISVVLKEYYEKKSLKEQFYDSGLLRYAQRAVIPQTEGETIHFHRWDKFALADDLTEGSDPSTGISADANEVKTTLVEFGSFISIPNFGDKIRLASLMKESYPKFKEQVERTANYRLTTALNAGTSETGFSYSAAKKLFANGKESFATLAAGDVLTNTDIQRAVSYLEQQGAPKIGGSYICAMSPFTKADLMISDADFRDLIKLSSLDILEKNQLPMWAGAKIINQDEPFRETLGGTESTYAAAGTVITTYVFGAEAFGIAQLGGDGGLSPKFKVQDITYTGAATTIGYRVPFASVVLNEKWVVQIKSVAGNIIS